MGVNDVRLLIGNGTKCGNTEGIPSPVSYDFCGINAGIPYNRIVIMVFRPRKIRYSNNSTTKVGMDNIRIIHQCIGHTVNARRKRIVQQANSQITFLPDHISS